MTLSEEQKRTIIDELLYDNTAKMDGSKKNLLFHICPLCGHDGYKFGMYIGKDKDGKKWGASHCFHCGGGSRKLSETLQFFNKEALMPEETFDLYDDTVDISSSLFEDEIDDSLVSIKMPKGYKRTYKNAYLKSRGWVVDDYVYFPVGTNRGMERSLDGFIIIEIIDEGRCVGYVARNMMSKEEIDVCNARNHYFIKRYNNSSEEDGNGFAKLLYNVDAIEPGVTQTVIICEGVFDVVALTRKLDLYDNKYIVPVATFGKKISKEQMYKLQSRNIRQIVLGYDNDAKETTSQIAADMGNYFDVFIADIPDNMGKDWDEMDEADIYDIFAHGLKTVREFNLA